MAGSAKRRSVRPRTIRGLLVLGLALVLLPVLLLHVWLLRHHFQAGRADELTANLEVARAVRAAFESYLDEVRHHEEAIAYTLTELAPAGQEANSYLAAIRKGHPEMKSVSWLDGNASVVASSQAELVGTRWKAPWASEVRDSREWLVTNVTRPRDMREATFEVVLREKDRGGALRGVVVAVIDPNRLDRVIDVRRSGRAAVSLVDSSGWLAFRLPALVPPYEERDWGRLYSIVRRGLGGEEAKGVEYSSYQKGTRVIAEVPIGTGGWAAGAGRPEEEVIGPLWRESERSLGVLLLVALLGGLVAAAAARRITEPVSRLRAQALAVGHGELERAADLSGPDELVDLGVAFNRMAAELREREEALRESEQRHRELFESMQEGFALHEIICDGAGRPVDYRFLEVNPAFERLTGIRREEVVGKTVLEVLPGIESHWIETYGRVALGGEPTRIENFSAPLGRHYEAMAFSPKRGRFAVVLFDVTERRQAEEALRETRDNLERQRATLGAIVENTEAHLVYLDRDFNFVWVNSAYARGARRPESDFPGHNHFEFYPNAENEAIFRMARDTGEPVGYIEKPFVFPDMPERGVTYWDWTLTPLKGEGGGVYALVFSLADVTERVEQREMLLAAERARTTMAETLNREIGHRVKNNLAMTAGLLQMQIAGEPNPRVVATLQDTITRLYTFADVHDRLGTTTDGDVKLLDALRRVADSIQSVLPRENVAVSVDGDEISYRATIGTTLCLVANELLTNAVKHGAPGPDGQLRVRARLALSDGRLHLTVWNSGNPVRADLDLGRRSSMGISLVQSLVVGQYRGLFTLAPDGEGTLARVVLSDEALREGG